MNKFITKVAKLALGLSLAAGVGVAVGTQKVSRADAAAQASNANWIEVTALSGLNATDVFTIATNDGAHYWNGTFNKGHLKTSDYTASTPSNSAAGVVKFVNVSGNTWKVQLVSNNNYLIATAAKSGSGSTSSSDSYGWTFSYSSGFNATYQETGKNACLRSYNNSDFRTYANTNSGAVFKIYKYQSKTLSSISVSTAPTKTTYYEGDYFDPTGLVITRTYSDSTSDTYSYAGHTSEFTFSPTTSTSLTTSNTSVTITYGGKTTSQAITVNAARSITGVAITGDMSNKAYTVGDSWDYTGLFMTVTYNTGDPDVVALATAVTNLDIEFTADPAAPAVGTTSVTLKDITHISYNGAISNKLIEGITCLAAPSTFTWDLSVASYTTGTDSVTWSNAYATMTNEGTNATNYLGGDANNRTSSRFYANNDWAVTPEIGVRIAKIVLSATTDGYATVFGGSTFTNATASVSSSTVTVTPVDGTQAISAVIGGTCGFTSVVVHYYLEEVETYTVSFNHGTDASGSISPVTDVVGSYTLPDSTGLTAPTGKVFIGWKANNSGDLLAAGSSYTVSADVTFYAQWAYTYTVTYTAGTNGTGSYAHSSQIEGTYTLLAFANLTGVSANSGYRFKDYTVGGLTKNPGDEISLNSATAVTVNFEEQPNEDIITVSDTGAEESKYADHTVNGIEAVYFFNNAKASSGNGGGIQIRSDNNSGAVSTTSGGLIKSVLITYTTGKSGQIDVYGSNTAYTSPSDLYEDSTAGTLVGSVSSTGTVTFSSDYRYVGLRSSGGARYLDSIKFTWGPYDASAPSIQIDQSTITTDIGETGTLTATVANAGGNSVSWSSSDSTIVSINASSGAWEAHKVGAATITATLGSTGKTSTVVIGVSGFGNVADARDLIDDLGGIDAPYHFTVAGYVVSSSGDGTSNKNNSIYIADEKSGETTLQIFFGYHAVTGWAELSVVDTKIEATGTLTKFNTSYELKNPTNLSVVDEDMAAVQEFVEYLHLTSYTEDNGYCKDNEHHYYLTAKEAYNDLIYGNATRENYFATEHEFAAAKARYEAWAVANNDAAPYDGNDTVVSKINSNLARTVLGFDGDNNNTIAIIVVISMVSVTAIGGYFFLKKRREQN